jgi:hypothetical protein
MSETHVTTEPVTPDAPSNERVVTPPKRDRAEYMREYRARRAANNPSPEIKDQIERDSNSDIHKSNSEPVNNEPQSELNKLDEQITAEEYKRKVIEADAATEHLKAQIAATNQAQELNRQVNAARMAPKPPTRDELLEYWRQQGLSDANLKFLRDNPDLIDGYELTLHAANQATNEGHVPDTPEHREATKVIFHKWMAEAHQTAATKLNEPPPEFFKPTPAPSPTSRQQAPSKSSHYSAPVSRETPTSRIHEAEQDPTRMTLTPAEVEAAKISRISLREYAEQKLRMLRLRANGEIEP